MVENQHLSSPPAEAIISLEASTPNYDIYASLFEIGLKPWLLHASSEANLPRSGMDVKSQGAYHY